MSRRPRRTTQQPSRPRWRLQRSRAIAQIAEQFDAHPNQVTSWKAQLEGGATEVFDVGIARSTVYYLPRAV